MKERRQPPRRPGSGGRRTVQTKRRTSGSAKSGLLFLIAALIVVIVICSVVLARGSENRGSSIDSTDDFPSSSATDAAPDTTKESESETETEPPAVEPQYELPSDLNSRYAILFETATGKKLVGKNDDVRTFPASITKIMTVLVAIENIDDPQTAEITLEQSIFDYLISANASVAGFQAGETVKAIDLMYAAMLPSGADGSIGLAELVSGSEAGFVELMNKKAAELGMNSTHFSNVTGLHDENHYTTLRDLSVLMTAALKNDLMREIMTTKRYTTSATNIHSAGITFSHTVFTSINASGLQNDYIIGGKTGYTLEAGQCLASVAVVNGKEYAFITTGAGDGSNKIKYNVADALSVYEMIASEV